MPRHGLPPITDEQRRLVGQLVLAGNQRVELLRQLAFVEYDLRLALVNAYFGGVAINVLASAGQIDKRTVYSWLNVEGVRPTKRNMSRAAAVPILGLDPSEISRRLADREVSVRLATNEGRSQ
jgi:hypothetical protein